MEDLTFGEQVKIILSRKKMTIKQLAEIIEVETGMKMSRQNLTQRLGRDNFQEQDMRMIASILGCSFALSILSGEEVSAELPIEVKAVRDAAQERIKRKEYTDGIQELMLEEPKTENHMTAEESRAEESRAEESRAEGSRAEEIEEPETGNYSYAGNEDQEPETDQYLATEESEPEMNVNEQDITIGEVYNMHEELDEIEETATSVQETEIPEIEISKLKQEKRNRWRPDKRPKTPDDPDFEPVIKHDDVDEDLEKGDINPYSGREYQTNSVRMHPNRIGYVQVYDRSEHKWTDMTEWAFLGYQERKNAWLGKEYEPPIYLD